MGWDPDSRTGAISGGVRVVEEMGETDGEEERDGDSHLHSSRRGW